MPPALLLVGGGRRIPILLPVPVFLLWAFVPIALLLLKLAEWSVPRRREGVSLFPVTRDIVNGFMSLAGFRISVRTRKGVSEMMQERRQVLEMLAEGKISAVEAEMLLEKLNSSGETPSQDSTPDGDGPGAQPKKGPPKYLRVVVNSTDGDAVNIRVPLALVRTGIKLSSVVPNHVSERLAEQGIDLSKLSELDGDELNRALEELTVDVESGSGDTVKVFCE